MAKDAREGDVWWGTRPRRRVRLTRVADGRARYVVVSHPNPDRIGGEGDLSLASLHRDYYLQGRSSEVCWSCGVQERPHGGGMYLAPRKHEAHCPRFQDRHKYRGLVRLAVDLEVAGILLPKGLEVRVVAFSKWAPEKFVVGCPVDASMDAPTDSLRVNVHGVPVDALEGWPEP